MRGWLRAAGSTPQSCSAQASSRASFVLVAQSRLRLQVYASGFTAPVAFVQDPARSQRPVRRPAGRPHSRRAQRRGASRPTSSIWRSVVLRAANAGCSVWRSRRDAASGRFFVNFTNRSGDTVVARFRRSATAVVADPASRFDLRLGRAAPRSSRSRSRITTAAISRSVPTAISTSASATADRATIRSTARRIRTTCSARCCASTSTSPTTTPPGIGSRPTIRSSAGEPVRARPEIWAFGLRNPWRYQLRRSRRAAARARSSSATSARAGFEEIDYEPRGRGGRNYGWRNREGAHDNVTVAAAGLSAAHRSDLRVRPRRRAVGHRRIRLSRPRARRGLPRPVLLRRLRLRAASGRLRSTIDGAGEARASDWREHTAELGGPGSSATSARSASTPTASSTSSACRAGQC